MKVMKIHIPTVRRGHKMKCRECNQEREGGIVDKIPVCHVCYEKLGGVDE
jgi:hypothetical protein